jgi:hypothetical protein
MENSINLNSFELCSFEIAPAINGINVWTTFKAKVIVGNSFFKKAEEQAFKKAQQTMNANQSGVNRDFDKKYQNQLRGTLAEIYVQELFLEYFKSPQFSNKSMDVIRYDDVRTDEFKESAGEYDIKIIINDKTYFLESRSSVVHDRNFTDAIKSLNMIGPYVSSAKFSEKSNDFYVLPLYRYLNFGKKDFYLNKIETLFENQSVELHLVVAAKNEILQQKGQVKSLGQFNTQYKVLQILNGYELKTFFEILSTY